MDILKNAGVLLMNRQIDLPDFSVTSNLPSQMNGGKDFCEWSKKDREMAGGLGKALEFILGKYGKGLLSLALAESFLEKGRDSYEIANLANKGMLQAQSGEEELISALSRPGVLSWLHVLNQNAEEAAELLVNFRRRVKEGEVRLLPNLSALQIRMELYRGKTAEALEWLEQAPNEDMEFYVMERFRYLTKVRVYLMAGRHEKAINLLQRLRYYSQVMKRTYIGMETELLLAITQYRMGNPQWDESLKKALTEAEGFHFVRIISREGAAVNRLLKETTWKSENSKFRLAVFAETEKMSLAYPGYLKTAAEEASFNENALKILKLQAEGFSTSEIAQALALKVENVKYHNKQISKVWA